MVGGKAPLWQHAPQAHGARIMADDFRRTHDWGALTRAEGAPARDADALQFTLRVGAP